MSRFAEAIWAFEKAQCEFKDALDGAGLEVGEHYQRMEWDDYDVSIELCEVNDDVRLTPGQQKIIFDAGFVKIYVNHKDGWETHYSSYYPDRPCPVRGWRRRIEHNTEPGPSGVIEFKTMKISYMPESWKGSHLAGDNRIEIVPDQLEAKEPGEER